MELTNKNENSFDPTPKLKSSPILINFFPFNQYDSNCFNCGDEYIYISLYDQKYCKKCLFRYVNDTTDNDTYLDVHIRNKQYTQCNEHEISRNHNFYTRIQEWCEISSEILYFKQIIGSHYYFRDGMNCNLCGKLMHNTMCADCYLVSSGWIESLYKKPIPILYLPWWDTFGKCLACDLNLKFESDRVKWCSNCYILYSGCRYCLTTNIIFGFSEQSQCRKCKRITIN